MKKILVAYATREGHTAKIAEHVAGRLKQRGLSAFVMNVAELDPFEDGLEAYDAAVLCASVHIGKHEREMVAFAKKHAARLSSLPSAFLSVSLTETTAEDATAPAMDREKARHDVDTMIERFLVETGWLPTATKPVAGALTYTKYGFIVRIAMKRIARAAHGSTDTSRDHVYTDWAALDRFIDDFVDGAVREEAALAQALASKVAPV